MKRKSSGFTLIELLVVISIIALLMSVMMPALGRARNQAKKVACGNTLRQLGISMATYAADNKNKYPNPLADGHWIFGAMAYPDTDGDFNLGGGTMGFLSGPAVLLRERYLADPKFLFCPATGRGQLDYEQFMLLQSDAKSDYVHTQNIDDISWVSVYIGYEYWVGYRTDPKSPVYQPILAKSIAKDSTDRGDKVCMSDALATTTRDDTAIENPFTIAGRNSLSDWTMVNHKAGNKILGANSVRNDGSVNWTKMKTMLEEENSDGTKKNMRAKVSSLIGNSYWWF